MKEGELLKTGLVQVTLLNPYTTWNTTTPNRFCICLIISAFADDFNWCRCTKQKTKSKEFQARNSSSEWFEIRQDWDNQLIFELEAVNSKEPSKLRSRLASISIMRLFRWVIRSRLTVSIVRREAIFIALIFLTPRRSIRQCKCSPAMCHHEVVS